MLTHEEIRNFMDNDEISDKKKQAKIGQRYYNAEHDILDYRLFYYDANGDLVEDEYRSNVRIPHPFFTEIVDQTVQYILSGEDGFVKSDLPELQEEMDNYFNCNENFLSELAEMLTGVLVKGFDYMKQYKNADDVSEFQHADGMGVVEVRAKDTDKNTDYVIWWYIDRIEKGKKKIKRIQVWDGKEIYFCVQTDEGEIEKDTSEPINPKPHTLYQEDDGKTITYGEFGHIPFFRMDNGKKQLSDLKPIKPLIDDYDIHACSLSNNLIDFDTPLHVVKGYNGDDLDKLQKNLKTKKVVGTDPEGGIEVHTVAIPFEARLAKLELDEKNIYRFGMGLNTSGLKDTNATTNIAIKAAYSLLELKCYKLIARLKQFMRKIIAVVLQEINEKQKTDYQQKDVYFHFEPEIMSNAQENAAIALTEAQTKQVEINTLLNVAAQLGDEKTLQLICEQLEIDFEEVKGELEKLKQEQLTADAISTLEGVMSDDEQAETPIDAPV